MNKNIINYNYFVECDLYNEQGQEALDPTDG